LRSLTAITELGWARLRREIEAAGIALRPPPLRRRQQRQPPVQHQAIH
jgi:hypothetical protein